MTAVEAVCECRERYSLQPRVNLTFTSIDYTVIVTGTTGSGKSEAINFFMKEKVCASKWSLKPVTTISASCTRYVGGKYLKVVETPGFLDPSSLSNVEEFKRLAEAVIAIPNGINALGLVINMQHRISKADVNLLEKLLNTKEMIKYTFIIFTHAKLLGNTHEEQRDRIEEIICDSENCPKVLQNVLANIKKRYIVLESVEHMDLEYHSYKSNELLQILQGIMDENKKPFTCVLNHNANLLENAEEKKEELIEALTKDLQTVKQQLEEKEMMNNKDLFWKHLFYYAAGAAVAAWCVFLVNNIPRSK